MKKHMTQEVAIKSAWMILEGLGFSREINGDLEKTVAAVYESAPAADVVEVVRCADCKYDERCMFQSFMQDERVEPYDKTVFFCADGKRKGGQDDG